MKTTGFLPKAAYRAIAGAAFILPCSSPAHAFDVETGSGLVPRWDNLAMSGGPRPSQGRVGTITLSTVDQDNGNNNPDGEEEHVLDRPLLSPLGQVHRHFRPTSPFSLAAYYQDNWSPIRFPVASSPGQGSERQITDSMEVFFRNQELGARDSGEWGFSARYRSKPLKTEFGLYWVQRQALFYLYPGAGPGLARNQIDEEYAGAVPETTRMVGANFATTWKKASLGSEVQLRRDTSITGMLQEISPETQADNTKKPAKSMYLVSNSVRLQLSAAYSLPATLLWNSATMRLDFGRQRSTSANQYAIVDPSLNRQSRSVGVSFTPAWQEALPNLNISLPISFSYSPKAQAPLPGLEETYKGGKISIGASAVYQKVWNADVRYMRYIGEQTSFDVKTRNFLWISVQRSF